LVGLQPEKLFVLLIQDTRAISAAPGIEIHKRPCFCLCPFRAHLVNDSAVNHFGAYAGGIVGDFDMEFRDRWCEKRKSLDRDRDLKVGVRPRRKNSEQRQDSEAKLQRQHEWSARQCLSGPIA
jgi:hypothetical protein